MFFLSSSNIDLYSVIRYSTISVTPHEVRSVYVWWLVFMSCPYVTWMWQILSRLNNNSVFLSPSLWPGICALFYYSSINIFVWPAISPNSLCNYYYLGMHFFVSNIVLYFLESQWIYLVYGESFSDVD